MFEGCRIELLKCISTVLLTVLLTAERFHINKSYIITYLTPLDLHIQWKAKNMTFAFVWSVFCEVFSIFVFVLVAAAFLFKAVKCGIFFCMGQLVGSALGGWCGFIVLGARVFGRLKISYFRLNVFYHCWAVWYW